MKGFIKVTAKSNDSKVLVALSAIKLIQTDDDGVNIGLAITGYRHSWVVQSLLVSESYDEVVAKIKDATE